MKTEKNNFLTWDSVLESEFDTVIVIADGYEERGPFRHYEPWSHDHKIEFSIWRSDYGIAGGCDNQQGYFFYEKDGDFYIKDGILYCDHPDLQWRDPEPEDPDWDELYDELFEEGFKLTGEHL